VKTVTKICAFLALLSQFILNFPLVCTQTLLARCWLRGAADESW